MKKKIFNFSNTYAKLSDKFFHRIEPKKVRKPKILKFNNDLAKSFGLKIKAEDKLILGQILSGNVIPEGAEPIAMVYAGHQFGNFVPQLGDGRAILLGEILDNNNRKFDIQLKGSGVTKYSRDGDGRAPLGPVIREYIISEAMYRLNVPTTRSLAMVETEEIIHREEKTPCGILTRIASSHIRIGTFEYFNYKKDFVSLTELADYTISRHFKEISEKKNKYQMLLERVQELNAKLVAKWMSIGFIHGVMNTDNVSVSGETIDYGPCAFMDHYNPNQVFSYIDFQGRYSFFNQGKIMFWNISKFAESILPILNKNNELAKKSAIEILQHYPKIFEKIWLKEMKKKIGLLRSKSSDFNLLKEFLEIIHVEKLDFTNSFRYLSLLKNKKEFNEKFINSFKDKNKIKTWIIKWESRLKYEKEEINKILKKMESINPVYIPRNHIVEKIIEEVAVKKENSLLDTFLKMIENPFKYSKDFHELSKPPKPEEIIKNTFCGT